MSDGSHATVTALTIHAAPPGQTIATYNLEVAQVHNFFVDDAGVLVHNVNGPCKGTLRQFEMALTKATTKAERLAELNKLFSRALPKAAQHSNEVFKGSQHLMKAFYATKKALAEYPTYTELKAALGGMLEVYGLECHHLIDKHLVLRIKDNIGEAINTMPAFVLHVFQHRGQRGNPGWTQHMKEVEEKFMNKLASDGDVFDGQQLRKLLRQQYTGESNEPIHHALDLWLTSQGI